MRYQLMAFRLALGKQLKRRSLWAMLAVVLILAFSANLLDAPEEPRGAACVGVVLPEEGTRDFWQLLETRSGRVVEFILTDEATLFKNVAASRWDCGLILEEDFEELLQSADAEDAMTLVTGPGSTVYPLVRETVAAVVAELITPAIAWEYLTRSGIADETESDVLQKLLEEELAEISRVDVTAQTLGGETLDELRLAEDATERILLGSFSVVLMVWSLYAAIDLRRLLKRPFERRVLALRGAAAVLLPELLAALLPILLMSAAGIAAVFDLRCAVALLPYFGALGAISLLLANVRGVEELLPVVIPFAAAACFVLCPIFADVTLLAPQLRVISGYIPVTLYLEACAGSGAAVWKLSGMTLALAGMATVISLRGRRVGKNGIFHR